MKAPEIFLDEPFATRWRGRDAHAEVERLQGVEYRAVAGRRTFRTEIDGRGYFVKIHRGIGWGEIFKNLLTLRLPVLGAGNEYAALRLLAGLGVASMRAVAYGRRGSNPARQHSFLITEELAPTLSLDLAWRDPVIALTVTQRRALIGQVAEMTRRMHGAGLNHRDLYLCHFLLHTDTLSWPVSGIRLSLIDLHRAQIRSVLPRRWRNKDLAALYYSAREAGVSRTDCWRFLRAYFACPLHDVQEREARLLRFLQREYERLRRRYMRKYFNQTATE